MNESYILMHRDTPCALIAIDRDSGALTEYEVIRKEYTPFLGNADERLMKIWWEHRAVPGSRKEMEEIIREAGCENSKGYLAKNLALSMTDTYWICPVETELSWQDVNLYRSTKTSADVVTLHNASSYDPNASLGGEMNKYWDVSGDEPVLVKRAYRSYGQQSINELFATKVHERQNAEIPFVSYTIETADDNAVLSRCRAFTSQRVEFISAYEILHSQKRRASRSEYDQFIDACERQGLDRDEMQRFMDYLILSDFAISNTDEHLQNFGVLRDTETMELIGPAPVFDSGNSMFFDVSQNQPLQRKELLERKINSFHSREEKMLSHVRDRDAVDADALPTDAEVKEFYESHGIPPAKAGFIAESYHNKRLLLRDFQRGRSISLFREKIM
ncbi:MAG: HipA domain-containing protein [Firmicutes bacterium]|nr:HipA domain-containing protein [Bacillota bacterium]